MPKIKKLSFRKPKPTPKSSYSPIFTLRTKILLFTGLFLMLVPLVFYINQTIQLMFVVPTVPITVQDIATSKPAAKPTTILIAKIRMNLPIAETTISNNTWTIASDAVSHLDISVSPGEKGPIILYAHNTNSKFGPIRWLQQKDVIEIVTEDEKKHQYAITETVKATPDQLSIFFTRKNEALYLFTCDGFADLKRYIVIAEPIASQSATASLSAILTR